MSLFATSFYFISSERSYIMYKNRASDGKNNISSHMIAFLRKQKCPRMSQRQLAEHLQLYGIDLDKNAIQRIESGERFVTDIELKAFSQVLNVPIDKLLEPDLLD